jgi:hypothetical protein
LGKKIYDYLPEMDTVNVTPYFESLQEKSPARFMMKTQADKLVAPQFLKSQLTRQR